MNVAQPPPHLVSGGPGRDKRVRVGTAALGCPRAEGPMSIPCAAVGIETTRSALDGQPRAAVPTWGNIANRLQAHDVFMRRPQIQMRTLSIASHLSRSEQDGSLRPQIQRSPAPK